MRWRIVWALAYKDLIEVRREKQIMSPMLAVPFGLCAAMPATAILLPQLMLLRGTSFGFVSTLLENAPAKVRAVAAGMPEETALIYMLIGHFMLPLFLAVPVMATNVIAADSVAGERERGTLESLVAMPIRPIELLAGKLAAAWVPAVLLSWISFVLYCVVVDGLTYRRFGHLVVPDERWLLTVLLLAPAAACFGLAGTVLISAYARGVRQVQAWSGLLALPVFALAGIQVSGAIWFTPLFIVGLSLGLYLLAGGLLVRGAGALSRQRLGEFATGGGP
jgi:hypothetical protein